MKKTSVNSPRSMHSRGVAMVAALGLMAVAAVVMVLLFMRTMDELQHGRDDAGIVQTLLVAQGGANIGVALLRADVREYLDSIATARSDSTGPWSFGTSGAADSQPTHASVASDLALVADELQARIDTILCEEHEFSQGQSLSLRIHVTDQACGEPLPDGTRLGDGRFVQGNRRELGGEQRYALPFVMVADGMQGQYRRRVVTQGEYQFDVGRVSFARYALFTNEHVSESTSSDRIWFTNDTLFDGPVHTNGNFNFFGRPWFGGDVTSAGASQGHGQGAFGYNNSSGQLFSANTLDPQGNTPNLSVGSYTNLPTFAEGVDFRAAEIELPENAHDQRVLADQNGILLTRYVDYLEIFAADASGEPVTANSPVPAVYQYIEVRTRPTSNAADPSASTTTYRVDRNGRLERHIHQNDWAVETENFNGLIYSDQHIDKLRGPGRVNDSDATSARPALAAFSQITIVPQRGARITRDLIYEDQPCEGALRRGSNGEIIRAICDNLDAVNVLGIFTPTGNIEIGHNNNTADLNAPSNVRIQASLLTSNGVVRVEDFRSGSARGAVQLLGGIIEEKYGAFGTFSSATGSMSTGYAREFTFDPRLRRGLTPPFFPTVGLDGVKNVFTFTFGHREQIY